MGDETCADHTPCPEGYLAWHAWAGRMSRTGHRQVKCPGCGLWAIWLPQPVPFESDKSSEETTT